MKNLFFSLSTLFIFSLSLNISIANTPCNIISTVPCAVTGKITDDIGESLIGVSITVKGTSIGTITDIEGKYSIQVPNCDKATLVYSYTGYATSEQEVGGQKIIDVILTAGLQLEEVVVTGYGIQRKKSLTGAISRISSNRKSRKRFSRKNKSKKPSAPSISQSLGNVAPGIKVQDSKSIGKSKSEVKVERNTEDYSTIQENQFQNPTDHPLSTFSIDVDAASYSNMRRFINYGQRPPTDAIRIEEMVNYFNYDYPQPADDRPFKVVTEISECPWKKENRLLHIGLQGKKVATQNLPASNLVFLIDVSGSMGSPNKLPLLQSSFKLLVDQLRQKDKVALVVYAGAAGVVLPSTNGANKNKIKEAIDNLQSGGSTAGGAGIQLAYKIAKENFIEGGNNRVILATDGDFNVGASSDGALVKMIEEKRESGVFLTVMGFGMGNYKDNKMQQLANKGNGNHAYIDNLKEAKKVLVNEFGGTLFTIAKDVKLQLEFNPSKVQAYRLIGYENRMLATEDFNDDKKDAGELGSGHTVTAIYEIIPTGIDSKYLASVDKLKYQKTKVTHSAKQSDELVTIKLRYKKPDEDKSQLIEKPVIDNQIDLEASSSNFKWSAAVAEFGMLLRDSEYKGDADFKSTLHLAKAGIGKDTNGYRKELIEMIKSMQPVIGKEVAEK